MSASTTGRWIARTIGVAGLMITLAGCSAVRRAWENAYAYQRKPQMLAAIRRLSQNNPLYY